MYIVELERGVWLAPWDGDPGRTLDKNYATKFKNKSDAERKRRHAQDFRPFMHSKVVEI